MKLQLPRRRESAPSFESDPTLTTLIQQLRAVDSVPVPALRFESVAARKTPLQAPRAFVPTRRSSAIVALGVALIVAAGLALASGLTGDGSSPVSAASVLDQAGQAASVRAAANSTGSFHKVTRAETDHGGNGVSVREWRQWGDGPDRWRVEVYASNATGELALESVRTSDGTTMYTYEAAAGELETEPYDATTWRVYGSDGGLGGAAEQANLEAVIAAKEECYTPTFAGKERVAGRETYVIDLGSNRCAVQPSGGGPGGAPVYFIMPTRLWIDVETFSVVRQTKVGGPNDQLRSSTTLISYERAVPIAGALFVIDPRRPTQ